jgi:hypothetical protein
MDDEAVIDIPEAGAAADLGRQQSYAAAREGFIPTIQVGPKRYKVPVAKWAEKLGITPEKLLALVKKRKAGRGAA